MYPSTVKPKEGGSLAWLFFKFGFVGGLGLFLNEYVMYALSGITLLTNLLTLFLGPSFYLAYAILSSQVAVLVSFLMNERLVFRDRKGTGGFFRRMALFNTVSSADLVVRIPLLWSFVTFLPISALVANFESILLTFTGRFLISEKKIWAKHQ